MLVGLLIDQVGSLQNKVNGRTQYGCEHAKRRRFLACIDRSGRKDHSDGLSSKLALRVPIFLLTLEIIHRLSAGGFAKRSAPQQLWTGKTDERAVMVGELCGCDNQTVPEQKPEQRSEDLRNHALGVGSASLSKLALRVPIFLPTLEIIHRLSAGWFTKRSAPQQLTRAVMVSGVAHKGICHGAMPEIARKEQDAVRS